MQRVVICTVGIGGWYPRGVARMIEEFNRVSPGYEILAWVNTLPPGTPNLKTPSCDYTAYAAKSRALRSCLSTTDVDIALLLDAAFFPIQHIQPLIEHIAQHGYYLCKNGYKVGQWASDRCLAAIDCGREHAMGLEECSSYAVGINVHHELAMRLAHLWAEWCIAETIVGHHTSLSNPNGRNRGPVSDDPRVMGHRHDQTVLSILANRLGLLDWCERPRFTTYDGQATTEETVLLNRGGIA